MTDPTDPRRYYNTNRRNIDRLQHERDRAGLQQLADTLAAVTGPHAHDAARLITDAHTAIAHIDATTPREVTPDSPDIRIGDILTYRIDGTERQGIVLTVHAGTATTNLGDDVALHT
jgi:hypothetical protein